jgi:hypothetical protein
MVLPLSWAVAAGKARPQRATRKVETVKDWLDGGEWYYHLVVLASGIKEIA